MKNLIIYSTYLLSSIASSKLMAQITPVKNIKWEIASKIPASSGYSNSIGLAGAISGTHNNVFIVAGGTNFPEKMPWLGGQKRYYDEVFVYNKKLSLYKTRFKLPFNLAYSAVGSSSNGIIVAGGENENGLSNKVILLNWKPEIEILNISYLPDLPFAITNSSITIIGEIIYLAGGEFAHSSSDEFLSLDLRNINEGWKRLPKIPQAVSHTVLLNSVISNTSKILLIGGRRKNQDGISTIYKSVYQFDLKKENWTEETPLPYPLSAASGVKIGNELLIFSGDEGKTFSKVETLIAELQQETNLLKKESLNKLKTEIQSLHPGFSKTILKYNLLLNQWSESKIKLPYGTVTTNAVLFNNHIIIAGGEVRAGVRTANILEGKIE